MTERNRLQRIESKLTRTMLSLGLDSEGNPQGAVSVPKDQFDDIIAALDMYLTLMDTPTQQTDDAKYNSATALYNALIDLRSARWRNNPTS